MKKKLPINIQKEWGVPQVLTKNPVRSRLLDMLFSINQISNYETYYFRDFYEQKIIVDSPTSTILCGYPKVLVEKEGFDFYHRILGKKEWKRIAKAHQESAKIFFKYPHAKRRHLVFSGDFKVKTANGEKLVLSHWATPFQLCDSGNLWLSLCSVSVSAQEKLRDISITNTETGEEYVFLGGRFVLSDKVFLSKKDIVFLELLCSELPKEEIMFRLKISERTFWRRKKYLFEKLNVCTSAEAVHKAHLLGLI